MMEDWHGVGEKLTNGKAVVAWAVLIFVLTFLGALPFLLGGLRLDKLSPSTPMFPLAFAGMELTAFAPTLAALLVTGLFPGAGGTRSLLRQVRTWRVGIGWYGLVLIGPMILFLLADAIHFALGGPPPQHWLVLPSAAGFGPGSLTFFIGMLLLSFIGEEFGWRGFAQPRLQNRYGALRASILIGILWGTWHLWPLITPGGLSLETPADVAATYIRMISTAIIYAWLYNSTKGSLFLVMVAHAGHNMAATLVQAPAGGAHHHLIIAVLYLTAAIGVVLATDPRTLCRGSTIPAPSSPA